MGANKEALQAARRYKMKPRDWIITSVIAAFVTAGIVGQFTTDTTCYDLRQQLTHMTAEAPEDYTIEEVVEVTDAARNMGCW